MLIKVCGIKYPANMIDIVGTNPDMMGFIFSSQSPRYMINHLSPQELKSIPPHIIKTGVFVNESTEEVIRLGRLYNLNAVQLHGSESPETCETIKEAGFTVLKAFRISDDFDFELTKDYSSSCSLFIFDAYGSAHGGNGIRFEWEKLQHYTGETAFLLSGGLEPQDVKELQDLKHPRLSGFDINSKFEIQPGEKDVEKVKLFISDLRSSAISKTLSQQQNLNSSTTKP